MYKGGNEESQKLESHLQQNETGPLSLAIHKINKNGLKTWLF